MLVTIALNNYNYAPYIKEAIDSALNQTYQDIEVIVVDDGSTDGSKEIIESYGDKIKAFFKENGGQVSAVNKGWEEANGEIVFFLDSDDVLKPEVVEKCVELYKQDDYINVYYMMEKVDKDLQPKGGVTPDQGYSDTPPIEDIKKWGFYACPPTSAHSFRKSFLDKVMPVPLRKAGEEDDEIPTDAYLSTYAPFMGKMYFIPEPLAYYRLHGNNKGSLRNRFSKEKLRRMWMRSYRREQLQIECAKKHNISLNKDQVTYNPIIVKYRLLSYRIFTEGHPAIGDSYLYLLKRCLVAPFKYPYFSVLQRLKYLTIMVAIGLLPRPILIRIIAAYTR